MTVRRLPFAVAPVVLAAVLVAVLLGVGERDPKPRLLSHAAVAPGRSAPRADGTVFGTDESPQQVAREAVENSTGPDGTVLPDLHPIPAKAFRAPVARYREYAVVQARAMDAAATSLRSAVARGDRTAARTAFGTTFDHWLLAGAAYGALGSLDATITGSLDALEAGLWSRRPVGSLRAPAGALAGAGRRLPAAVRRAELTPLDFATRAHEILEDVQRDRLGDRLGVRATADSLAATRAVIGDLEGLLRARGDVLAQVQSGLGQLSSTLAAIRRRHAGWPPPQRLTRAEHERLTGRLGATLEALAGVPGDLETTYPPAIPKLAGGGR
ncbi:EfeM/EfeO family lipoprotein [Candidatus Solirubrobacter pratensis]|uniref:EfeM/EfeO family lipoprotein n=1 Tax=Candidatus Solirubrobacter pratensis TaxID=1298857 RepID=UPI0004210B8C|nr:EfeM/EfeO family lipoprotein [Candidatus Solirubrobacter pratensis]